jgi:hypothetical protein
MSAKWEELFNGLKADGAGLLKGELATLLTSAKADSEAFVKKQAEKTELYMNQLAAGEVTVKQVEGYLLDIKDLTALQALKLSVAGKASAQRLVKGIEDLILNGLFKLLV